jgi:hypothetical protein
MPQYEWSPAIDIVDVSISIDIKEERPLSVFYDERISPD